MQSVNLSIIIPMYNGEKTISKCLHSILRQIGNDVEVLVVDDGSKDQSLQIASAIAEKDSRVSIITKDNGGVSSARNTGIRAANGKYIMFIDCDDCVGEGYFNAFVDMKKRIGDDVMILSRINVHYAATNTVMLEGADIEAKSFLNINRIVDIWESHLWNAPFNKLFLKSVISDNDLQFDTSVIMGEDWLFNNAYLRALNPSFFYILDDVVYDYYLDADPWRHGNKEDFYDNNKRQVEDFRYTLKKLNIDEHEIEKFNQKDLNFTITELKRIARDHTKRGKERIKKIDQIIKKEAVASRIKNYANAFSKVDFLEFSAGNAIKIYMYENFRERLGLVRKKCFKSRL